ALVLLVITAVRPLPAKVPDGVEISPATIGQQIGPFCHTTSAMPVESLGTATGEIAYNRGYPEPGVPSDAEKVARLERSIEQDEAKLAELKGRLDHPNSEYSQAEAEFKRLDAQVEALRKRVSEEPDDEAIPALE